MCLKQIKLIYMNIYRGLAVYQWNNMQKKRILELLMMKN